MRIQQDSINKNTQRSLSALVVLFLPLFLILLPHSGLTAEPGLQVDSRTDWFTGILELDITAPIEEQPNQPTGRFKTEQHIIRKTPVIAGEVLQELRIDSSHTLESLVRQTPVLLRSLEGLSEKMSKVFTTATGDRKHLTVRYTLSLFPDLADLVIRHKSPYPIPVNPIYSPGADFTGIVIYAGEPLPLQGEYRKQALLQPCLFPRLYDTSMRLIHSAESTEPEALRSWGNAGYTHDFNLSRAADRIGSYPLRTMARRIAGSNRTDLILPEEAVKMIIGSEHNRRLLQEGRVLIILPPSAEEDPEAAGSTD